MRSRALVWLLPFTLAACGDGLCGNRVTQRALAPDGRREAVVFVRDCGATTAFATHVTIGAPGEVPEGSSGLFVATRGNAHPDWGDAEAHVEWTRPAHLTITRDALSQLFESDGSFDGGSVTYRTAELLAQGPAS